MEAKGLSNFANSANKIDEKSAADIESLISNIRSGNGISTDQQMAEFNRALEDIAKSKNLDLGITNSSANTSKSIKPPAPVRIFEDESDDDDDEESEDDDESSDESSSSSKSSRSSGSSRSSRYKSHKINQRTVSDAIHDLGRAPNRDKYVPREKLSIETMIAEIDIYTQLLRDTDYKGDIPQIRDDMTEFEVYRVHTLIKNLATSKQYGSLAEDAILVFAGILESYFDGSKLFLGRIPINYNGLSSNISLRIRNDRAAISSAVKKVAEDHGLSPNMLAIASVFMPLFSVPLKNYRDDVSMAKLSNPKTVSNLVNYVQNGGQ